MFKRSASAALKKGADWLWNFDWALRYTDSIDNPFVMTEAPFLVVGDQPGEIGQTIDHPESLVYYPICWQACLFGSRRPFDKKTDKSGPEDMETFLRQYRSFAKQFLVSPTRLDDITELPQPPATGYPGPSCSRLNVVPHYRRQPEGWRPFFW